MNTIVTDMLQWPHRIVVPIGGIPVDIRYLCFIYIYILIPFILWFPGFGGRFCIPMPIPLLKFQS